MGFEDEAEQSLGRPCRKKNGRTKRTHELTSSIVPRGTSFHCWVELWFSPIGFNPERFSCCCRRRLLPRPPELGAVNPDAVHDHGQPASQGHSEVHQGSFCCGAARRAKSGIGQILRGSHGFKSYYVLDGEEGVAVAVMIFEDRESANAANNKIREFVRESLHDLDLGDPEIIAGEVLLNIESDAPKI